MLQWRALFLLGLLALGGGSPVRRDDATAIRPKYRLPGDVIPFAYEVTITPVYNGDSLAGLSDFSGKVTIYAKVEKTVNIISLHRAANIEVDELKVYKKDEESTTADSTVTETTPSDSTVSENTATTEGSTETTEGSTAETTTEKSNVEDSRNEANDVYTLLTVEDFESYNEEQEIFDIEMVNGIEKDTEIKIEIQYSGRIQEGDLTGMYRSEYEGRNGNKVGLLTTQFESTYARKAFPCFDEPGLKATFELSIMLTAGIKAIANTAADPAIASVDIVKFKKTPIMSTYLLAFVIYEEEHYKSNPAEGFSKFRTWSREEAIGKTALSQRDGPKMLDELAAYTEIDYYNEMGMEKMEQAAITDFKVGAMENWGLVTYRESALLFAEDGSTAAHKRVSEVIAHEFAHHWFGNWVTTKWWDTTWLNEGLTNYFQYYVMNEIYSNWQMMERMILDEQIPAFEADSSINSPPLTNPAVGSPDSINAHFGIISYSKGGSIVRQIRNVLGEHQFHYAIRNYLQKMGHNAAIPQDLFDSLLLYNEVEKTLQENEQLEEIFKKWTTVAGYPVITVTRKGERNITLKQERFITDGDDHDKNTRYSVPLTWYTNSDGAPTAARQPQEWLTDETIDVSVGKKFNWIIVNAQQAGYYRVNYGAGLWQGLADALWVKENLVKVAPLDRAALINNALTLARYGYSGINYNRAFKLLKFLRNDKEFLPWAAARTSLAHVERMVGTTSEYKRFIKFIVDGVYKDIKFEDEGTSDENNIVKTHRVNVLSLACAAGYAQCLNSAKEQLAAFFPAAETRADPKPVPEDLQTVVYCYGLKDVQTTEANWEKLWTEYENAKKDDTRRAVLTTALGCTVNEGKLNKYLENSLNSAKVRPNEAHTVFVAVYSNPIGVDVALKFLQENYDVMKIRYGEDGMNTIVPGLASRLNTKAQSDRLSQVVEEKYSSAVRTAQANEKWMKDYATIVRNGMREASGAATALTASLITLLCATLFVLLR